MFLLASKIVGLALLLPLLNAQTTPVAPAATPAAKGTAMVQASGTFEVKMAPTGHAPDATLGSMSLDKVFHGELEGTSKGEMLSAGDPATGNAGYVAMERVTGTLAGKTGTFALMQSGVMSTGSTPLLTVTVVPGSGTGELAGIYGTMAITIAEGKHSYALQYAFAPVK